MMRKKKQPQLPEAESMPSHVMSMASPGRLQQWLTCFVFWINIQN